MRVAKAEAALRELPDMVANHELFIEMRNGWIAHSSSELEENKVSAVFASDPGHADKLAGLYVATRRTLYADATLMGSLEKLAHALCQQLGRLIELERSAALTYAQSLPSEFWDGRSRAVLKLRDDLDPRRRRKPWSSRRRRQTKQTRGGR